MKTFMTALALGALVLAPAFAPSASAQRTQMDSSRERAMQECMAMNRKENHDPYGSTGGVQHHYRACMMNHGQFE
jgi:hypothetical protein